MGEVYRARDGRLKRDVAIKILPDEFSQNPDPVSRFQREAEVLASLNHPNVAAIYDLQESAGIRYLVLELIEGETLADRIQRGAIPLEEAIEIGKRICEAVEAAHEIGVIHRDLKPANVKITPNGDVKVLDFGLAKTLDAAPADSVLSHSPTLAGATNAGVIIGTAAYMSPEQARGRTVNTRSDVWAFGCVLYEMLTAKPAFQGEDVTEILASIVKSEPDWNALPPSIPSSIRTLLHRCLQKDVKKRIRNMGDVAIQLGDAIAVSSTSMAAVIAPAASRRWILVGVAALLLGAMGSGLAVWRLRPSPVNLVRRFTITLPAGQRLAAMQQVAIALSPDGKRLAYVARAGTVSQLYIRELDSFDARVLPGTDGAAYPFFSPDGQWVGFFTDDKLKKVSISGGPPITLAPVVDSGRGGSWGEDGTIVFAPMFALGLLKIPAAGGNAEALTTPENTSFSSHRFPRHLPGNAGILFTAGTGGSWDDAQIEVLTPGSNQRKVLFRGGSDARYVSSGHLLFFRSATLMAVPFDLKRLEVTGAQVSVIERIMPSTENTGGGQIALSNDGSLIYVSGGREVLQRNLVSVDQKGVESALRLEPRTYRGPRLSGDGTRVAVDIDEGNKVDIWVGELQRGTFSRVTTDGASNGPVWSHDGRRILFQSTDASSFGIFSKNADGSGATERLTTNAIPQNPLSALSDGQTLLFNEFDLTTMGDLWTLSLKDQKKSPVVRTPAVEGLAALSPNARWIAYQSDDSGRDEIYLQPFPGPGRRDAISTEGGTEPVWSRDGRQLFYRNGDRMMSVGNPLQPTFRATTPEVLFEKPYWYRRYYAGYDVTRDGRFLMIKENEQVAAARVMNVVLNWFEELKWKVPPKP